MTNEDIINLIKNCMSKKDIQIDSNDLISDLGLSSLQMVKLAVLLENISGKEVNPCTMAQVTKVSDLVKLVN
jgi:acyl carrier protein